MNYSGSCHCGKVKFTAEGTIDGALSCNCSMCQRRGSLLWFLPRDAVKLTTTEDDLATYTFNHHVIQHRFCPNCGIHVYGEGVDPKGNRVAAVNIRALENLELDGIPVQHFDGRSR